MSNAIALAGDGDALQPGQIRFSQAALPPLPAGTYRLSATQTVDGIKDQDTPPTYTAVQTLQIQGPRFALAPGDLQSVMPPANQTGSWENTLPNVVLRRRTLPWERTLDGSVPPADSVPAPWIGLLTVTAAELGGDAGAVAAPSPVHSGTVSDLVQPTNPAVLGPQLSGVSQAEMQTGLLLLDLPVALFQSVAPTLADLSWLAHVREVNTDHKEILGLDEDGTFSIVVGNRTLQPGAVNYLFLVSLEGHQDHLAGSTIPSSYTTIRFASLAWWKVQADVSKGDFIEIMQALPDNGGVDLVQMPHLPIPGSGSGNGSGDADDPSAIAAMGLGMGYVPLTYRMRVGEQATAWYRGPASAVPTKADGLGPFVFSDQAIRYDPTTALFDVSQAAAWQIGRLLALSDSTFARLMFLWRKEFHQAVAANVVLGQVAGALPVTAETMRALPAAGPGSGGRTLALSHQTAAVALAEAFAGLAGREVAVPAADGGSLSGIPRRIRREDRPPVAAAPGLRNNGPRTTGVKAATAAESAAGAADPLEALLDHVFGPSAE
ncbi:hypothetical protein TSA6c_04545 [Azospirillum sp. TSA6c]|uniref:hypothetical protein n=1 Tax=Azospirillum sp. TSA6c TaxID=709813 RepID=UPI000D603925|nr:hypothetical protein [Azospirillum sp. TSA6c]PWC46166.1 hypothetical protein TSA6c_04545 [Azospirillum sp. TSA6c]